MSMETLLGTWGKPPDSVAWTALGVAGLLAFGAFTKDGTAGGLTAWLRAHRAGDAEAVSRRRFLMAAGFVAAFLSLGYIAFYLRGGPRIIDATSYFLQGRALSHGMLDWAVADPSASFRGRFLFFHEPNRLAGIFPPGYPLLLSLGFLIGAPMVVGPLLAAGIVVATYLLAKEIAHDSGARDPEPIARFAALLSIVCVAVRYHTADTMAHGACSLAIALAMACAFRARRLGHPWLYAVTGLLLGYVVITRPVSAIPITCVSMVIAAGGGRRAGFTALGVVPGLLFLAFTNTRVAGHSWLMPQTAYYAVSDGPPGCFRYGFGSDIGCVLEHGDFVKAHLLHGYGVVEALGTTFRRLRMHLTDVVNFEPLFLLLLVPMVKTLRGSRACRMALLTVVLHIVAYAPFYFDGNYPGGGARLFADVLPVEHAVIAFAVAGVLPEVPFARRALLVLAVAVFGFSIHSAFEHRALAEREGGRPMYEPDLAKKGNVDHGLLFFDTDHGFNLAHDPAVTASHGVEAVRLRNDDRDRLLYDWLGHPFSHIYRFSLTGTPVVESWVPPPIVDDVYRFEAEADWPPLSQGGGYAQAAWVSGTGASGDRALEVIPTGGQDAWAELELPIPRKDSYRLSPRVLLRSTGGEGRLVLFTEGPDGARTEKARWEWKDNVSSSIHKTLDLAEESFIFEGNPSSVTAARLVLWASKGPVALDKTTLKAHR
jgi:hypothetical protein